MSWIINHNEVEDEQWYIVCAIGGKKDETYLYQPQTLKGWAFKRLLERCYAAIPMPEWQGLK